MLLLLSLDNCSLFELFIKFLNEFINHRIKIVVFCHLHLMLFGFNVRKVVWNLNATNFAHVETWFWLSNLSSENSWIWMHLRLNVVIVLLLYSFSLILSINSFFNSLEDWETSRRFCIEIVHVNLWIFVRVIKLFQLSFKIIWQVVKEVILKSFSSFIFADCKSTFFKIFDLLLCESLNRLSSWMSSVSLVKLFELQP